LNKPAQNIHPQSFERVKRKKAIAKESFDDLHGIPLYHMKWYNNLLMS